MSVRTLLVLCLLGLLSACGDVTESEEYVALEGELDATTDELEAVQLEMEEVRSESEVTAMDLAQAREDLDRLSADLMEAETRADEAETALEEELSRPWPSEVKDAFVIPCAEGAVAEGQDVTAARVRVLCQCMVDELERQVSLVDFVTFSMVIAFDQDVELDPLTGLPSDLDEEFSRALVSASTECLVSGSSYSTLEQIRERGFVRVGVANEIPYGYVLDDGEVTGIAPDVARAVFAELGIEALEPVVVPFDELIPGLQAGRFDVITAGMYINPERATQISFSDPDFCTSESFAVAEGNPEGIVDYQSFVENPDLTLAVASGSVEMTYAENAEIPDSQLEVFTDFDSTFAALEAGEVDAAAGTSATVVAQVAFRSGIEAVDAFFPKDARGYESLPCGGYGFRLEDTEFRDAFNDVLNQFREDGTTIDIITRYSGFSEADIEFANSLTVDDFLGE